MTALAHRGRFGPRDKPASGGRAATVPPPSPVLDAPPAEQATPQTNQQDAAMIRAAEILFVDPAISDLATLLGGVRPGVEAIVLDPVRPAARQLAAALAGRSGLDAVHIVAHGAPGRVRFAAGEWSAETLAEQAADFAAIGQALGERGGLLAVELLRRRRPGRRGAGRAADRRHRGRGRGGQWVGGRGSARRPVGAGCARGRGAAADGGGRDGVFERREP